MAAHGKHIKEITDTTFESEVLKSKGAYLIDLSATWCGPCRALAPIIDELSGEYVGKVQFGVVDIDQSPEVPTRYRVRGVPTLLMFKDGQVVGQITGLVPKQKIVEMIEKAV